MGWILRGSLHSETTMLSHYAPDLLRDRFYQWLAKWHWLPLTLTGIALLGGFGAALGGWKLGFSWLLWGVFLRISIGFPRHLAGQFCNSFVGYAPFQDPRRLNE